MTVSVESIKKGDRFRFRGPHTGALYAGEVVDVIPELPRPVLMRPSRRSARWVTWVRAEALLPLEEPEEPSQPG